MYILTFQEGKRALEELKHQNRAILLENLIPNGRAVLSGYGIYEIQFTEEREEYKCS